MERPRYARPFVAAFLAAFVVCALVPLNLWPFSSWELFSRVRSPIVSSWEAVAVERNGAVADHAVGARTTCVPLLRSFGATRLRIYHLERSLSHRVGSHATPWRRTIVSTCTTRGRHASS